MDYMQIVRQELKRYDHANELTLKEASNGNASISGSGVVRFCPAFGKTLQHCDEIVTFEDGSIYKPSLEERISAVMAHEVAHWKKGHCKVKSPSRHYQDLSESWLAAGLGGIGGLSGGFSALLFIFIFDKNAQIKQKDLFLLVIFGFTVVAVCFLVCAHYHLKAFHLHREDEHEADICGMDLMKRASMRPEAMLWLQKCFAQTRKKSKNSDEPDRSFVDKVRYLASATHPIPHFRYERCLQHLNKI